jgi:tRNA A-37 threonylcarbamoyl transferase component Bud32
MINTEPLQNQITTTIIDGQVQIEKGSQKIIIPCIFENSWEGSLLRLENRSLQNVDKPYFSVVIDGTVVFIKRNEEKLEQFKAQLKDPKIKRADRLTKLTSLLFSFDTRSVDTIPSDPLPGPTYQLIRTLLPQHTTCQKTVDRVASFFHRAKKGFILIGEDRLIGLYKNLQVVTSNKSTWTPLGSGGFGTVTEVPLFDSANSPLHISVAIKRPTTATLDKESKEALKTEVESTEGVSEMEHVVTFHGPLYDEDIELRGLVLSKFPSNMRDFVALLANQPFEKRHTIALKVFSTLVNVISNMHKDNKIHNDIKLENIVIDYDSATLDILDIALIDFSNTDPKKTDFTYTKQYLFSREYRSFIRAFEQLENLKKYASECKEKITARENSCTIRRKVIDVRLVAFCIYEMLNVEVDSRGKCYFSQPYPLTYDGFPDPDREYEDLPERVDQEVRALIQDMLHPTPSEVPTIDKVSERLKAIMTR